MGIIAVEGLGNVEIDGDAPTAEEARLMLRAIEVMESRPAQAPVAAPAPGAPPKALYHTMEEAVAADVARDAAEAGSTLVGAATVGGSQVLRGLAEAPFVAAEALTPSPGPLGMSGVLRGEAEKVFQAWREQEGKTFRPSVTLEEAEGLEYVTWVAESVARMLPGMGAAMASMPAYAISLVADTARERARADGRDEVNVTDVAAAAAASGFIAASERFSARVALGGALPKVLQPLAKTIPGRITAAAGTELATEVPQEAAQYLAERLGTEQGMAWEELKPRLKEAAVLAPIVGGGLRGGREAQLAFAQRAGVLPEAIYDDMIDKEVVAQEAEATVAPVDQKQPDKAKGFRELYERRTEPHPSNPLYRVWDGGQTAVFDEFEHDPDVSDIHLEQITTFTGRRGEGVGSRILQEITKMADESGATVSVEALSKDGPMSTSQLVDWYRRHGFNPHPEYGDEGLMVRPAKGLAPSPVEEVVEAVDIVEERPPSVPGEYTQVASPLEAEAVDIQMESKKAVDAIDDLQKGIKAAEEPTPPAPPRPGETGAKSKPVKPQVAFKPPNFMREAYSLLRKYADPETAEADLLAAAMHVIGRKRRIDAKISDDEFAAKHAQLNPYIKQIAERMGMTQGDVDAMERYERISYADTIRSAEQAGLAPTLTPTGVEMPAELDAIIKKVNATSFAPTTTEQAAIHWALMLQRKRRSDILDYADPTDPTVKADLAELDQSALETAMALKRAGTELGRAMRYRQFIVSPVMDLIQAQAEASIRYGGKLDQKTKDRIEDLWAKAEEIEATGKRLKKEAKARMDAAAAKLETAKRRLVQAEMVASDAADVVAAAKRAKKRKKAKTPREKAVEEAVEALDDAAAPIPVKPLRKSKEQRAMEKDLRAAESELAQARGDAAQADSEMRRGQALKSASPKDATTNRALMGWEKIFGASIALKASTDLSAFGRQAGPLILANPFLAGETAWEMAKIAVPVGTISDFKDPRKWKAMGRAKARALQTALLSEEFQTIREIGGLDMTEVEGASSVAGADKQIQRGEEEFMFRALESGFFSHLVVPSKNTFSLTLNTLRAKNYDALVKQMAEANGIKLDGLSEAEQAAKIKEELPEADMKAAGMLLNVITGRATLGAGTGVGAELMRRTMFAPRFTISRFESPLRIYQLYRGKGPFKHMSEASRGAILKRVNNNMWLYASLFLLTALYAGDEDDTWQDAVLDFFNPNSASFQKARVGDYHFDMFPGVPASVRHIIPMLLLPEGWGPEGYEESHSEYFRGLSKLVNAKAAPVLAAIRTLSGYDWTGREIDVPRAKDMPFPASEKIPQRAWDAIWLLALAGADLSFPITPENAVEAWSEFTDGEKDMIQSVVPVFMEFLGFGVGHFDPKKRRGARRRPRRPSRPSRPSGY